MENKKLEEKKIPSRYYCFFNQLYKGLERVDHYLQLLSLPSSTINSFDSDFHSYVPTKTVHFHIGVGIHVARFGGHFLVLIFLLTSEQHLTQLIILFSPPPTSSCLLHLLSIFYWLLLFKHWNASELRALLSLHLLYK